MGIIPAIGKSGHFGVKKAIFKGVLSFTMNPPLRTP